MNNNYCLQVSSLVNGLDTRNYSGLKASSCLRSYLFIFTGIGRGGLGRLAVYHVSAVVCRQVQTAAVDTSANIPLDVYGHVLVPDRKHVVDRIADRQPICSRLLADCRPSTVHNTANVYSQYAVNFYVNYR
jgi:hypothetical protein